MNALWRLLRTARFARAVLVFLAAYAGIAAWLPWVRDGAIRSPGWAGALALDRPFASPLFIAGIVALFASTLACTWGRRARVQAVLRGELADGDGVVLSGDRQEVVAFLRAQGFRGRPPVMTRFRLAAWGGWLFHVGLLVVIAAVAVQQSLHDEGSFRLAIGERTSIRQPGVVFGRRTGFLSPGGAPDLELGLVSFDPELHQRGYAPDRASRVLVRVPGEPGRELEVDRADGVRVGGTTVYQAIPAGLALVVEIEGLGARAIHLREDGPRMASAQVGSPGGGEVRFSLRGEHALADRLGSGALAISVESSAGRRELVPGESFSFGDREARLVSVTRWAGFTYARSPGMPGIFAGFALVIAGALLLAFPAAVARFGAPGEAAAARVVGRGADVLLARWRRHSTTGPGMG